MSSELEAGQGPTYIQGAERVEGESSKGKWAGDQQGSGWASRAAALGDLRWAAVMSVKSWKWQVKEMLQCLWELAFRSFVTSARPLSGQWWEGNRSAWAKGRKEGEEMSVVSGQEWGCEGEEVTATGRCGTE